MRPTIRPIEPPASPIPQLAECLGAHGRQLAAAAAAAIYREGRSAGSPPRPPRRAPDWIGELRRGCESGIYRPALQATTNLMQRAHTHAASLLERHAFLERFGQVCARTLVRTGAEREEIAGSRRLFAALQQGLLEARD